MAKVVLHDTNGVKEFVILGEVTIGRLPENTVAVFDPQISRKHARISMQDGQYVLEDLGSAGGTRVNNQPVTRQVLQDTDQIQVGGAHLVFLADKPKTSGDGLFEKTMVGNDPLFAPTMVGGGPPPAPPAAPASPAPPPPVSAPPPAVATSEQKSGSAAREAVARPTIPVRPRIILPSKRMPNKRRVIQLVAAVVILGIGGAWVYQMMTTTTKVEVDWAAIEKLFKENRISEAQSRIDALGGQTLEPEDQKNLTTWKTRIDGLREVGEVEALVYEKGDFAEASRRALADGNRYPDQRKQFGDLAKVSVAAIFLQDSLKETEKADEVKSVADLKHLIQHCREAEERYAENKAELERLPVLVAARRTCANRLASLEARLRQNQDATQAWADVTAARESKNWAAEAEALKRFSLLPAEITDPMAAPARAETLLKNATAFQEGLVALRKLDFDAATRSFSAVEPGDTHYELAQAAVAEMRANADYSTGAKLYREGKADEALVALVNAKTDKAIQLRARIQSTVTGYRKLLGLQERKVLEELIAEAARILPTLDVPEDGFYREAIEKMRLNAQRQRIEALGANVEQLALRNRLGEAYLKSGELLKDPDIALFPELQRKVTDVRDKSLKTIQQEVGAWVQNADQLWNQYKQDPITSEERTVTAGVSASFRKKAALLNQTFDKIAQVQGVVQALPEDKAKPVLELYEQIRQEILRQAEKVFAVRTQYSQLGNFERTRQADEMILLLGDVPGNQYYRLIVKKE